MTQSNLTFTECNEMPEDHKKTEVCSIPKDWIIQKFKDCCIKIQDGNYGAFYPKSNEFLSYGIPFLTSKVLGKIGRINYDKIDYISQDKHSELKKAQLKLNDVLLTNRGGSVGAVAMVNEIIQHGNIGPQLTLLRVNDCVKSNYLYQYMKSNLFQNQISEIDSGSAMNFFGIKATENFLIPLPPNLDEQQKIATALTDTDALISELEKLIEKKQAIKTATMQQLLTGKTRLPEFALREDGTLKGYKDSELGVIPEDWEVVQFDKHIEKIIGGGTPSRSIASYWGQDIPWVTVKDFATFDPNSAQEYITNQGLKSSASNLIPAGILITSTRMALGKALIYQVDVAINQDLKAIFTKPSLDTTYLKYWFDNNAKKIDDLGSGSTVKGISLPDLKTLSFIEMSLLEQLAIKNILVSIDEDLSLLKQRYEKTKSIKQGMMQELLTGKTRIV